MSNPPSRPDAASDPVYRWVGSDDFWSWAGGNPTQLHPLVRLAPVLQHAGASVPVHAAPSFLARTG